MHRKTNRLWFLLKITYGLFFVVAGLDKFFNFVVDWQKYVNPAIPETLHINIVTLMTLVAIIEITLGILVLTRWTRIGAYGIALWFVIIVINLLSLFKYYDIAVRDTVLAIGALVLAQLTEVKEQSE